MEGQEGHGLVEAKPVISALYLRDFKVAGGLHLRCAWRVTKLRGAVSIATEPCEAGSPGTTHEPDWRSASPLLGPKPSHSPSGGVEPEHTPWRSRKQDGGDGDWEPSHCGGLYRYGIGTAEFGWVRFSLVTLHRHPPFGVSSRNPGILVLSRPPWCPRKNLCVAFPYLTDATPQIAPLVLPPPPAPPQRGPESPSGLIRHVL
jgi:hypothetical protein